MIVLGVDASGPANRAHTAACMLDARGARPRCVGHAVGLGDADLLALAVGEPLVVGIDAPLGYGPTGGDRPGDRGLRAHAVAAGLPSGTVMAPTAPRMAYLTLRGVVLARALQLAAPAARIVEVHPGAALACGGADPALVRAVKSDAAARAALVAWLGARIDDLPAEVAATDHAVMAAAAAWAAWRWATGAAAWTHRAEPPLHPFDISC